MFKRDSIIPVQIRSEVGRLVRKGVSPQALQKCKRLVWLVDRAPDMSVSAKALADLKQWVREQDRPAPTPDLAPLRQQYKDLARELQKRGVSKAQILNSHAPGATPAQMLADLKSLYINTTPF